MTRMTIWMIGAVLPMATAAVADPSLECSIGASSQVEIGACLEAEASRAEAALGVALDLAREGAKSLDEATGRPMAGPALEAGQAAWLAYRDAHCEHVGATFGGGSGTGIAIASCRVDLTRLRIDQLIGLAG